MDDDPANSSFTDYFMAPDDDFPKLVVVGSSDDIYYPYSRASLYSSLFISSLFFFVFFILLVTAIIQCRRSTRIPHEEFVLVPSGPVPGYMTIVQTHPNGSTATTAFRLYPKNRSTSRHYSDQTRYHSQDGPPSYQSMTQDVDPPTYQSVNQASGDRALTCSSRPNTVNPTPSLAAKKTVNSSNPFRDSPPSATNTAGTEDDQGGVKTSRNPFLSKAERPSLRSESDTFTDDDVFYEVNTCLPPEGQNDQKEEERGQNIPDGKAER